MVYGWTATSPLKERMENRKSGGVRPGNNVPAAAGTRPVLCPLQTSPPDTSSTGVTSPTGTMHSHSSAHRRIGSKVNPPPPASERQESGAVAECCVMAEDIMYSTLWILYRDCRTVQYRPAGTDLLVQTCWFRPAGTDLLVQTCWFRPAGSALFLCDSDWCLQHSNDDPVSLKNIICPYFCSSMWTI
ncbi:unnamed protein product [Pleuronectes platessa]|uniref:Uncharacterized protein n=1 Tax=Pleuronectes platessa TaxID=8262 RepID=A0A9N7YRF1_PLEPL|nr:unnamed protein product [Pleuronectes platessa]